jgi:hypothetical protein
VPPIGVAVVDDGDFCCQAHHTPINQFWQPLGLVATATGFDLLLAFLDNNDHTDFLARGAAKHRSGLLARGKFQLPAFRYGGRQFVREILRHDDPPLRVIVSGF